MEGEGVHDSGVEHLTITRLTDGLHMKTGSSVKPENCPRVLDSYIYKYIIIYTDKDIKNVQSPTTIMTSSASFAIFVFL